MKRGIKKFTLFVELLFFFRGKKFKKKNKLVKKTKEYQK